MTPSVRYPKGLLRPGVVSAAGDVLQLVGYGAGAALSVAQTDGGSYSSSYWNGSTSVPIDVSWEVLAATVNHTEGGAAKTETFTIAYGGDFNPSTVAAGGDVIWA